MVANIEDFKNKELHEFFKDKGVNNLYLVNLYCENSKTPFGFVVLTYEGIMTKKNFKSFIEKSKIISESLIDNNYYNDFILKALKYKKNSVKNIKEIKIQKERKLMKIYSLFF